MKSDTTTTIDLESKSDDPVYLGVTDPDQIYEEDNRDRLKAGLHER